MGLGGLGDQEVDGADRGLRFQSPDRACGVYRVCDGAVGFDHETGGVKATTVWVEERSVASGEVGHVQAVRYRERQLLVVAHLLGVSLRVDRRADDRRVAVLELVHVLLEIGQLPTVRSPVAPVDEDHGPLNTRKVHRSAAHKVEVKGRKTIARIEPLC